MQPRATTKEPRNATAMEASEIAERRWPGYKQLFVDTDRLRLLSGRTAELQEWAEVTEDGDTLYFMADPNGPGVLEEFGVVFIKINL